ncbi:MAG: DUF11 domain-containing protein [Anaerolineae bacterium]|nr:DUF11 domain-containing protein [Anaerolineae bacterium]
MRRKFRLAGYLLATAIMVGTLIIGQTAWAIPDQSQENQTVPTRTPKPPTTVPGATSAPGPTSAPPTAAPPVSAGTATPTATVAAPVARLSLALTANPIQVWSGVTVVYTLRVLNLSATAVRNLVLSDPLPAGLEPGAIIAGQGAVWEGTTLRATVAELAAGAQVEIAFTARVAAGVPAGTVIINRARATLDGVTTDASVAIAMPPAELPAVGQDADRAR